jgi:hypothetical protein
MTIPPLVSTMLRSTAPTLLSALVLPPPFNVIASAVVSGVMAKYLSPQAGSAQPDKPLTPEELTQTIQRNAGDPELALDLRRAEAELQKYQLDSGIRFAEVAMKDRDDARKFQTDTGLGPRVFTAGMRLVVIGMIGMIIVVVGALLLVFGGFGIPKGSENVAVAAFGLIGTAVGFINGMAASVVNFYWGSSLSSATKSEDISGTLRTLSERLGDAAAKTPTPNPAVPDAPVIEFPRAPVAPVQPSPSPEPSRPAIPAVPARSTLLAEILPGLQVSHRHFPDGVAWQLTREGVSVDGAPPRGTPGEPTTVREIWQRYGPLCSSAAKQYGVPVELIVATIATESSGNPNARRSEPAIHDESTGLMQTLVSTAREALGRRDLTGDSLLDPGLSIQAGAAYIAQKHGDTHFDPPLVAAAYNAGSIRRDDGERNRWKLLCYPVGTGQHVDRFIGWFADCMRVSSDQSWGANGEVPSFAECLCEPDTGGEAPHQALAA